MTKGEKAHLAFIAFIIVLGVFAAVAGWWWQTGMAVLLAVGQVFGFFGRRSQTRPLREGAESPSVPAAADDSSGA